MAEFITNAIIESVSIDDADRGLLTAWLHLNYDGSGQGFGGHALYLPSNFKAHEVKSYAGHFIWRCMEIAGVSSWDKIKGKAIRVKKTDEFGSIIAIGHITKDDWFNPSEDFSND